MHIELNLLFFLFQYFSLKFLFIDPLQSDMFPFTDVSEVFHSIAGIISHIDDVSNVLSSSTSAFSNTLIQVLHGLQRNIR